IAPTAVALGFTLWQLLYRPRAQNQQLPQKMLNGTITRSPTCRFCTEEPTSSTTPMNSCPNVCPIRVSGMSPWKRCRSEPQIAASCTRTIASLGCSMRGLSFSSTRSLYGPRYVIARMVPPGQGRSCSFPGRLGAVTPKGVEATDLAFARSVERQVGAASRRRALPEWQASAPRRTRARPARRRRAGVHRHERAADAADGRRGRLPGRLGAHGHPRLGGAIELAFAVANHGPPSQWPGSRAIGCLAWALADARLHVAHTREASRPIRRPSNSRALQSVRGPARDRRRVRADRPGARGDAARRHPRGAPSLAGGGVRRRDGGGGSAGRG